VIFDALVLSAGKSLFAPCGEQQFGLPADLAVFRLHTPTNKLRH